MAKRYDLDMGKKRARKRLRLFIKKHVHNRKHANVLCFPGEFGTEIEDVYRKLGFRDCNIVGVEREKKAAKEIEERYPEIYVHQGDLMDFIRGYDGPPFDVVSLDYCGKATPEKYAPLALMSVKDMLSERCVVHFNVMAGRERKEIQSDMRNAYAWTLLDRENLKGQFLQADDEGMTPLQDLLNEANTEDLGEVRGDAITHNLLATLGYTTPAMRVCYLFDLKEYEGYLYSLPTDSKIIKSDRNDNGERTIVVEGGQPSDDSDQIRAMAIKNQAIQEINAMLKKAGAIEYLKAQLHRLSNRGRWLDTFDPNQLDYHLGRGLVMFFFDKYGKPHCPTEMDRLAYISESGRRMITDIVLFRDFSQELERIPDPLFPCDPKEDQKKGDHSWSLHWPEIYKDDFPKWVEWLNRIHTRYATKVAQFCKSLPELWPERDDVGGGTVTMTEEQVKEKVIGYIKRGRDNEYIRRKFPTLKKGRLAAIRAHVTMGTY